jgi:adenosylcobyric acid synthase
VSARALMIPGTASHVGKSLPTAGLGRIFSDDGTRVAPFKARNLSLNTAATPDRREIGRAQTLQAEACRAVPRAEMNPVLIKPSSHLGSQIVVLGRVWGQLTAFHHRRGVEEVFPSILESYLRLAASHELILLEGSGSPAEINLREHEVVNVRMAHAAYACCILVGNIDRGGVFACLLGTNGTPRSDRSGETSWVCDQQILRRRRTAPAGCRDDGAPPRDSLRRCRTDDGEPGSR